MDLRHILGDGSSTKREHDQNEYDAHDRSAKRPCFDGAATDSNAIGLAHDLDMTPPGAFPQFLWGGNNPSASYNEGQCFQSFPMQQDFWELSAPAGDLPVSDGFPDLGLSEIWPAELPQAMQPSGLEMESEDVYMQDDFMADQQLGRRKFPTPSFNQPHGHYPYQEHGINIAAFEQVSETWTREDQPRSILGYQSIELEPPSRENDHGASGSSRSPSEGPHISENMRELSMFPDIPDDNPGDTSADLVCFGVLIMIATSSFNGTNGAKKVPVNMGVNGGYVQLSFEDGKYAGLVENTTLREILENAIVSMTATLTAPLETNPHHGKLNDKKSNGKKAKGKKKDPSVPLLKSRERELRVVVYGPMSAQETIGEVLGDSGLHLQHPYASEKDRGIEYANPHYLLRPGSQLPDLENLSMSEDNEVDLQEKSIGESLKGRILRVLDDTGNHVVADSSIDIEPSLRLSASLKGHQREALAWLMEMENASIIRTKVPSLWEPVPHSSPPRYRNSITKVQEANPKPINGGILADEMGLGKTLSVLSLICSSLDLLEDSDERGRVGSITVKTTVVVAPTSTILSWQRDCERHIHAGRIRTMLYHGSKRHLLSSDLVKSDIIFTTYGAMRKDWVVKGPLFHTTWHRVVLDEAHHIRSRSSQLFKAAVSLPARRRWCLTGTPIHNSLDDLGALLAFIGIPPFMDKKTFNHWISVPCQENRSGNLERLGQLFRTTCLRRTKDIIPLPMKSQREERVDMDSLTRSLYEYFEERLATALESRSDKEESELPQTDEIKGLNPLSLINLLRMICDGGRRMLTDTVVEGWIQWQRADQPPFATDCRESLYASCDLHKTASGLTKGIGSHFIRNVSCKRCDTEAASSSSEPEVPPKLIALARNLRQEQCHPRIKSVVFSSWTKMLDLVQEHLQSQGFAWQRIDGKSSLNERQRAIHLFNGDQRFTVMLATIGSAGEGINLTAANNVHILEPNWNPMAEAQAINRIHRIRQLRDVCITRYITTDCIESYVQWVQADKLKLAQQSLDSDLVEQVDAIRRRREKMLATLRPMTPAEEKQKASGGYGF